MLARRFGDELHLVHVVNELGAELALAEAPDTSFRHERELLRSEADALRQLGARVTARFLAGSLHAHVANVARACRARLIVVASCNESRLDRLLGSEAEQIAKRASIPVLLVHDAEVLLRWIRREHRLRVLVGMGRSTRSSAALRYLVELGRAGACDALIACVHRGVGSRERRVRGAIGAPAHPYREALGAGVLQLHASGFESVLAGELEALHAELRRLEVTIAETSVPDMNALAQLAAREAIDLVLIARDLSQGRVWSRPAWRGLFRLNTRSSALCVPTEYVPNEPCRARGDGGLRRSTSRRRRGERGRAGRR